MRSRYLLPTLSSQQNEKKLEARSCHEENGLPPTSSTLLSSNKMLLACYSVAQPEKDPATGLDGAVNLPILFLLEQKSRLRQLPLLLPSSRYAEAVVALEKRKKTTSFFLPRAPNQLFISALWRVAFDIATKLKRTTCQARKLSLNEG